MSKAEQYLNEALAAWDFGGELVGAVRYAMGTSTTPSASTPSRVRTPAAGSYSSA